MAAHSSILAWRIPWTVKSMWLQRVGHDRATVILQDSWGGGQVVGGRRGTGGGSCSQGGELPPGVLRSRWGN